jgi:hypothetical protein
MESGTNGRLSVEIWNKIESGIKKFAEEADKVVDQGRMKVDELQLERQLDAAAKKLGHLEFDAFRGRVTDAAARQAALDEMVSVEDQIAQLKAQREAAKAQAPAEPAGSPTAASAAAEPAPETPFADSAPETPFADSPAAETPSAENEKLEG